MLGTCNVGRPTQDGCPPHTRDHPAMPNETAPTTPDRPFTPRHGSALLISGAGGAGKSFLAGRLASEAHRSGYTVWIVGPLASSSVLNGDADPDITVRAAADSGEVEAVAHDARAAGVDLLVIDAIEWESDSAIAFARAMAKISRAQVIALSPLRR